MSSGLIKTSIGEVDIAVAPTSYGNTSLRYGVFWETIRNQEQVLADLGYSPKDCVFTYLIGADGIKTVDSTHKALTIGCDVLVTRELHMPFMMSTGDCLISVFYDPTQKIMAMVHTGFMGMELNLPEKVVTYLQSMKSRPNDLQIWIGPGIRKESYLMPTDKVHQKDVDKWKNYLVELDQNTIQIDLVGMLQDKLTSLGVLPDNIIDSKLDMAAATNLYSHYRASRSGEKEGRNAVVAVMK